LGYEDLSVLSKKEKISILNYGYKSLDHLIEHIHFNDNYPQFKNVAITNINNDYAYRYCTRLKKMILCKKTELINDLIDFRMIDLDEFYSEYKHKLEPIKRNAVEKLIEYMNEDEDDKQEINDSLHNKNLKIFVLEESNMDSARAM